MFQAFIPYGRQWIDEDDERAVLAAMRSDFLTQGPATEGFEKDLAAYTGARFAVAVSNATAGLHLTMAALELDVGEGVTTPNTFVATANAMAYVGLTPVFADIDAASLNLSPAAARAVLTDQTRVIIPVHFAGRPADMSAFGDMAAQTGVRIVEDAAHAIGSASDDGRVGDCRHSQATVFSFHPVKTMTTGEGGIFVCSDKALYERVLTLSNHGRVAGSTKQFWPEFVGYKYKMSNVQAAIGCAQIERVEALIQRKRAIFDNYAQALASLPGVSMNPQPAHAQNGYWMPTVVFDEATGITRETLIAAFQAANIDARVFFWPLSELPMFCDVPVHTPVAFSLPGRAINLPSYHDMTDADQRRVIDVVRTVLEGKL